MTKVASGKFQSSHTNFHFWGLLPRGDGSGHHLPGTPAGGHSARSCAWERAAGQTAHVLSLGEPALQPVLLSHRLALSASSVDVLILCSHICPLPKGGQLGNDDGVVGETRVPV